MAPEDTQTKAWRPLVLDVRARDQREMLRVLREDSSLQVIDRLAEQREQLSGIVPPPAPSLEDEAQRWIYYPWRRAVVRLLGPRAFGTLRLDRNRNKITRAEQARQRTLRIGVIGLSAGHSIAHVLAMEGLAGELRLADFDDVELSNLNRIPGSVLDLGVNKAVVAARRIGEIDPYLRVVTITEGITPENLDSFLDGLDLVIEECDSLDVKLLVREAARERRIPGADGDQRPRGARRRALRPRAGAPRLPRAAGRAALVGPRRAVHTAEGAVRAAHPRGSRRHLPWCGLAHRGRADRHRMAAARQRGDARGRHGGRRGAAASGSPATCRRVASASTSRRCCRASCR